MTRSQLEHAIRAACEVANDTELWVFGSQAILGPRGTGKSPRLSNQGTDLKTSRL